ncbi:MAG: thylakoid membrane photosystem I accumulation factor [Cyanobacteria bacterium]|nr:thylakoid membrane photosystem I accumulation factor [Cyanobacteriota bacterium]
MTLTLALIVSWWLSLGAPTALAGLQDDRFDGNIFALYAGNGSLVPPRVTLADALQRHTPTLLVLYVEDSSDCKQYSPVISQLQAFYGRALEFIPINADSIPPKASYDPTEPGYYYNGLVPKTVIFDRTGAIVLNEPGQLPFEKIDDILRQVFDLLPRSESVELRRRQVNEVNVELTTSSSTSSN